MVMEIAAHLTSLINDFKAKKYGAKIPLLLRGDFLRNKKTG